MKYIDPSFPIPDASVQVIDTAHLTGLHAAALIPGETIALTVRVMNDGDATKLQTIIKLDDDTNHSEIYYEGAQTKQVGSGQSVDYVFQVQVPDTAKIGDHSIKIDIVDEHDVLGFKHEDWQKAFTVVEPQTEWNVFLAMQVND